MSPGPFLCAACKGLDLSALLARAQDFPPEPQTDVTDVEVSIGGWHERASDVFGAAKSNCHLCALVVQGWGEWRPEVVRIGLRDAMFDPKAPPADLNDDIEDIPSYCGADVVLQISRRVRVHDGRQRWSYFLMMECCPKVAASWEVHDRLLAVLRIAGDGQVEGDQPTDTEKLQLDRIVDEDPTTEKSIDVARNWIRTCTVEHTSCMPTLSAWPRRLLDVGSGSENEDIYLREARGLDYPRYVALSHCWGKAEQFCTTTSNMEAHHLGIATKLLPQTFRDAITIVRALDVRYLWIDSLCIIQDSTSDWVQESGNMAEIYRGAFFVLGAARAESDADGFLGPRILPPRVVLPTPNGGGVALQLQPVALESSTRDYDFIKDEPLNRRAWCLQERYLASRMLYYGSSQMFWECGEYRAWEEGHTVRESGNQLQRIRESANAAVASVFAQTQVDGSMGSDEDLDQPAENRYEGWYRMLEEYTRRDITKDSDRLPAVLGMASAFDDERQDQYLDGIWLGGLLEGLVWCSRGGTNALREPANDSSGPMPSWSWASVKGQVHFPIFKWFNRRAQWKTARSVFEPLAEYAGPDMAKEAPGITGGQDFKKLDLAAPVVKLTKIRQRPDAEPGTDSAWGQGPARSAVADKMFCFTHRESGHRMRDFWIDGAFDISSRARADEQQQLDQLFIIFLTRLPFVHENDFFDHRFGLVVRHLG